MSQITATRHHDICAGHRVVGHESKCRHMHGHNYRVHFHVRSEGIISKSLGVNDIRGTKLDSLGRVMDFSVIKEKLCMWIEENWDHKFLHWTADPIVSAIKDSLDLEYAADEEPQLVCAGSFVAVPFNPTAENMAKHLVEVIGPQQLAGTGIELYKVVIDETAKCSVVYELV